MIRTIFPLAYLLCAAVVFPGRAEPLPNTKPLDEKGDLALLMVDGIDRYLTRATADSVDQRKALWKIDTTTPESIRKSVQPNRDRLRDILGVVDERVPFKDLELVGNLDTPSLVAETEDLRIYAVRWPVFPGVDAEGLLLEPKRKVRGSAVAIPDASWTPEMLCGLEPGPKRERFPPMPDRDWKLFGEDMWAEAQFARRLGENGYRVLVPTLIDRADTWSGNPALGRMTNQPHREFLYRMAFQMGRHPLGYEVQKVLAGVDWLAKQPDAQEVGVYGYGEGGLVAFYAGALDERIRWTAVGAAFGSRQDMWREPIYRNLFGLLREFGDAEVAAGLFYAQGRKLLIENTLGPRVEGPPTPRPGRQGAAPGRLEQPAQPHDECARAETLAPKESEFRVYFAHNRDEERSLCITEPRTLENVVGRLRQRKTAPLTDGRMNFDPAARQKRQFDQLVAFTQKLMRDSEASRQRNFWAKLDTSTPEKYAASCAPLRKQFAEEVIGKLPAPTVPMNPRSRKIYDEPKWTGYEVVLDVHADVFAYGILLLPKDLKPGEKRPVVVCQHGLEGRPQDVCDPREKAKVYRSFGAALADRGYIVYAPQNPYIGNDRFRLLQRKANPLGLSLFSFITSQHERHLDWLASLPMVDGDKIAFYGLSYGGKTAMRVPALLPRYCLSICSGDFNEWTWKNVSIDYRGSYMFSPEWEMPEFNLGQTFGYAEMAALIAPRPFMVERGHDDPVGVDEWVAYEYAKVRRHYSKLHIAERTTIEFFDGGHEIHGVGTYRFLQEHLGYPKGP